MISTGDFYRNVLILLDGSPDAERVFETIEPHLAFDCRVALLSLTEPANGREPDGRGDVRDEARQYLNEVVARKGGNPTLWECIVADAGNPVQVIETIVKERGVDLIAFHNAQGSVAAGANGSDLLRELRRRVDAEIQAVSSDDLVTV